MAAGRVEIPITWSSASSITLSAATSQASDAITFGANDVAAEVVVKVDNQGTPSAGDVVNVFWVENCDSTVGYVTTKHAERLGQIDTTLEDPAAIGRPLRALAPKGGKVVVDAPQAATRNIVVSAVISVYRTA